MNDANENVLDLRSLSVRFKTAKGLSTAVNGLDLRVRDREIVGIVGESGSGKSMTALAILGLLPPGALVSGSIFFDGEDLLAKTDEQMRPIRGNRISLIFQEPMTALNPVFTVGSQLTETLRLHQKLSRSAAKEKAVELLETVHIPSPAARLKQYPHELSGGMRQRVLIAMALSCQPRLLIADEPTTALDVTIQAEILDLFKELREKVSMAMIVISHDLGVISELADRVLIMYSGEAVEKAGMDDIFDSPRHPYTRGLLASIPSVAERKDRLETIEGIVPAGWETSSGCRFAARCPDARPLCSARPAPMVESGDRQARCWKYAEEWKHAY